MGWLISISLVVLSIVLREYLMLIAAGLFAIAGSIEFLSSRKGDDK